MPSLTRLFNCIRWLAIIPACIVAWYIALFVILYIASVLNQFCLTESIYSAGSIASSPFCSYLEKILESFFVALSFFLIVLVATVFAPSHRILVSKIAYCVETVILGIMIVFNPIILVMNGFSEIYIESGIAIISGWLAILLVSKLFKEKAPDKSEISR